MRVAAGFRCLCDAKMRIAVISDTHGRYPPELPGLVATADEIWHLGDVGDAATLAEFELTGRPLFVVRGNCDDGFSWPVSLELEREGWGFFLTHIPPQRVPRGVAAVLHGHTHVARDELGAGLRWLNPGAVTGSRGGPESFAWLEVKRGRQWKWTVEPLAAG